MKRFTSSEKGGLLLAACFLLVGLILMVRPAPMVVGHAGDGRYQKGVAYVGLSKGMVRIYGGIAFAMGGGLAWGILFIRKNGR